MIHKILAPTTFPNEPQVTLYKDYAQLRKLAYSTNEELESFLKSLAKKPKHQYFLVNALGSDEAWGENANGDAFEEDELLPKNYKTFETHAKVFRGHSNKPTSKSYGKPVRALWNPAMHRVELVLELPEELNEDLLSKAERGDDIGVSMGTRVSCDKCILPGSLIETTSPVSFTPIEDLKPGDLVRTHTGSLKPVTKLFKNKFSGNLITLKGMGLRTSITLTDNHPVYVVPQGDLRGCHGTTHGLDRLHTLVNGVCKTCHDEVSIAPRWRRPDELKKGDYLVYPNFIPARTHLGIHFSYLLGFAAAAGRVNEAGAVDVSLWADEPEILNQFKLAASKINGFEIGSTEYHKGKLVTHRVRSRKLHDLFTSCFEKREKWHEPTGKLFEEFGHEDWLWFLAGAFDTNGKVTPDRTRFRTANPHLADLVQKVFWMLGAPCSITTLDGENVEYRLELNPAATRDLLCRISQRAVEISAHDKKSIRNQLVTKDFTLIPVTDVCQRRVTNQVVHNVAVDGDESYIFVTILHNCSWCGNLAKTKSEYCNHVLNELKHIREDGTVCKMLNKEPTFFDISIVNVPADKTAWFLSKVAFESAGSIGDPYAFDRKNERFVHEVYQKSVFSGFPPLHIARLNEKYASIPESVRMAEIAYNEPVYKVALRRKVADIDKVLPLSTPEPMTGNALGKKIKDDGMTPMRRTEVELSSQEIDDLAAKFGGDPDRFLSTLAAYGVVLKPREYQRLALGVAGGDSVALRDQLDKTGATFEHLDPIPSEIRFTPTLDKVDHKLAEEISPVILQKSYHPGALAERAVEGESCPEEELHDLPEGLEDTEKALALVGGGFKDYSERAVAFAREAAEVAKIHFPDSNLRIRLEIG